MATPRTVEEYIGAFPPQEAERLRLIRAEIVAGVPRNDGRPPEEKIRYGMAAVAVSGRYWLHIGGWKKHIGLYPVPSLPEPLEAEIAPFRAEKDSVVFPHTQDVPYDLIGRVAAAIARMRAETD